MMAYYYLVLPIFRPAGTMNRLFARLLFESRPLTDVSNDSDIANLIIKIPEDLV